MHYRPLAQTGLSVSEICLGTMQFLWTATEEDSYRVLDAFVDAGGNFIDTADVYSSWAPGLHGGEAETIIGHWMEKRKNRDKIILATKVCGRMWDGPDGEGLGKAHILRACEESLKRLKTDRIDLYQSHSSDKNTPVDETLSTYAQLAGSGKVRFIGCSNYSMDALAEALKAGPRAGVSYVSLQPKYSLLHRGEFEKFILPLAQRFKMAVIPYSPLAAGFLTGKYRPNDTSVKSARAANVRHEYMNERGFSVLKKVEEIAAKIGKTASQTALAWLLSHEWMTAPIIGANTVAQLNESLGAAGLRLAPDDKQALDAL